MKRKFRTFCAQNDAEMYAEILLKWTRGGLWGHMGSKTTQKGGRDPPRGSKGEVQGTFWGIIFIVFWTYPVFVMFFNIIHDLHAAMPKLEEEEEATNKRTNKRRKERTNKQTKEGSNEARKEETMKRRIKGTKGHRKEGTNEQTTERRNIYIYI